GKGKVGKKKGLGHWYYVTAGCSQLVGVGGDEIGAIGSQAVDGTSDILPLASQMSSAYLGPLEELVLATLDVARLARPGLEGARLQSTPIAEGQSPGFLARVLVDGVQVHRGLLLRLPAREESSKRSQRRRLTGHGGRHGPLQGGDGGPGDVRRGVLLGAALSRSHHVGLEQGALQVDVVVVEGLVHGSQHLLSHLLGTVQVMVSVRKHLGLHNRHNATLEPCLLAAGSIAGKHVGVLQNGQCRGAVGTNLQHATPLGEAAAVLAVLGATLGQILGKRGRTLSGAFIVGAEEGHDTFVHLDARDDAAVLQQLHEGGAVVRLLVQSLVKQDHSADGAVHGLPAREQQLTVLATVLLSVLHSNALQALAHGGCAKRCHLRDALPRGNNGLSCGLQLFLQLRAQVGKVASHL
ncbi:unnamed protein product, partial [Ixodes hexagonus]